MYEWNILLLLRTKERFCGGWGEIGRIQKDRVQNPLLVSFERKNVKINV